MKPIIIKYIILRVSNNKAVTNNLKIINLIIVLVFKMIIIRSPSTNQYNIYFNHIQVIDSSNLMDDSNNGSF
jgi:hypothetical protein